MRVVAEEPWTWFLFEDDGKFYLDVLVEHGAISFNVTCELTADQVKDYERDGAPGLSRLAGEMRHKGLTREWHASHMPPGWAERSVAAVHEWQKSPPGYRALF